MDRIRAACAQIHPRDGGIIGREIRRRLVEWWTKEYSANRMRLCVIGKGQSLPDIIRSVSDAYALESLDELSDLVSKLFSPVANRGREPLPMIDDHPFGPNEAGVRFVDHILSFSRLICM